MIKCLITLFIIFFAMQQPAHAAIHQVWIDGGDLDQNCQFVETTYMIHSEPKFVEFQTNPNFVTPESHECGGNLYTFYGTLISWYSEVDNEWQQRGVEYTYVVPASIRYQTIEGDEPPPGEMCEEVATLPIEPNSWEGEEISFESLKSRFTSKFPLDMVFISNQNGGGNEDCPVFNLLGRSMPACIIIMLVKSAKWPILISIIIRTIFSI